MLIISIVLWIYIIWCIVQYFLLNVVGQKYFTKCVAVKIPNSYWFIQNNKQHKVRLNDSFRLRWAVIHHCTCLEQTTQQITYTSEFTLILDRIEHQMLNLKFSVTEQEAKRFWVWYILKKKKTGTRSSCVAFSNWETYISLHDAPCGQSFV